MEWTDDDSVPLPHMRSLDCAAAAARGRLLGVRSPPSDHPTPGNRQATARHHHGWRILAAEAGSPGRVRSRRGREQLAELDRTVGELCALSSTMDRDTISRLGRGAAGALRPRGPGRVRLLVHAGEWHRCVLGPRGLMAIDCFLIGSHRRAAQVCAGFTLLIAIDWF